MASVHEKQYKFCPTCKAKLKRKLIDRRRLLFCSNCGFTFWNNPKPVTSVILHTNGKIMLLQRANKPLKNYWCLPGGYIDYEETSEEAIRRETKEGVGFKIGQLGSLFGVYRIDNDPRGVNIDIIYEAELEGKILLSEEHHNYKLFATNELPAKIAYKHRNAIEDWLKRRSENG